MDWKLLLTSTVVSTLISVILKWRFDYKLELQKQRLDLDRIKNQSEAQKEIEVLKNQIAQINTMQQKNLDYYHMSQQASQSKRIEAIDFVWKKYLDERIFSSPIVNFFSILLPMEYLEVMNEDKESGLNLNSLGQRPFVASMDTITTMPELEENRPFLGEVLYYKFRSAFCVLYRLRYQVEIMKKKQVVYLWKQDGLLVEHLEVIFTDNNINMSVVEIITMIENSFNLQQAMGLIEREINGAIGKVISGEENANLSLEWAEKLRKIEKGYKLT